MKFSKFPSKSFLLSLLVAGTFFISCKDEKTVTQDIAPTTTQELTVEQKKQALQNMAPASSGSNTTNASGAVNPPHGQPGHRCEIPVGAPLDGGNTNTSPTQATTPVSPAIGGNGINPPHGQPGHRCDIKVGDPL